ncbi:hypothetical protein ACIQZO_33750 [Streptomyces sp. NPDC097617]|uniref:hypothetical protein n=1 Tax=Streptomyces sp. NPDC097617 TaxID=3366091 RepID=UPI00381E4086
MRTGAWLRPGRLPLPADLEAFLDAGTPPVYVGFASMPVRDAEHVARVAVEAVRTQGRRILLSGGWADLAPVDGQDDCFRVGEAAPRHRRSHRRPRRAQLTAFLMSPAISSSSAGVSFVSA